MVFLRAITFDSQHTRSINMWFHLFQFAKYMWYILVLCGYHNGTKTQWFSWFFDLITNFLKKIENWFKYVINIFKMLRKPLFFDGVLMKTKGCFNFPKNKTAGVNKLKHQHTILLFFFYKTPWKIQFQHMQMYFCEKINLFC
jgi:hypothetical protein